MGLLQTALLVLFPFFRAHGVGKTGRSRPKGRLWPWLCRGQGCGCLAAAAPSGSLLPPDSEPRGPSHFPRPLQHPSLQGAARFRSWTAFFRDEWPGEPETLAKGSSATRRKCPAPTPSRREAEVSGTWRLCQGWELLLWGRLRRHRNGRRGEAPTEPAGFRGSFRRPARSGPGVLSGKVTWSPPGLCLGTLPRRRASRRPQRQASSNGSLFS